MRIAPPDVLTARVDAVRQRLDRDGLDGLVVTSLSNIAYLSGFFASATLVLTSDALPSDGDGRYHELLRARAEVCPFLRPRLSRGTGGT